jgi:TolB-like protein
VADIFVSYARADKARVAPLVRALEAQGWSVWWDPEINPGQEFDRQISAELDAAKAVIVAWTPLSVESRWVRGEAREAADRGILVPVRFEKARLPIDVRAVHTTDLDDWDEDVSSAAFMSLTRALAVLLAQAFESEKSDVSAKADGSVSIAVLPFINMSSDTEQEYFSDGISEDIITDLSKVSALSVIARNTAFTFKGRSVDVPQVARQLKVSHVLEGSVRKSGNRVRITAQLIDGTSGNHIWAERYDRDLEDIFALQDEISQAIVSALKLNLFPEEKRAIETRGTSNAEAYDVFLRARAIYTGQSGTELRRCIALYRRALELDPSFAQAWAGLSVAIGSSFIFYPETVASLRPEMDAALARATELAPELPEVRASLILAAHSRYDWMKADELLAGGDANHGTYPFGTTGFLLATLGRAREAVEARLKQRQADPLSMEASFGLQYTLDLAGRFDDAEAEYERSKDLAGNRAALEWRAVTRLMTRQDPRFKQRLGYFASLDTNERPYMGFLPRLSTALDEPEAALPIVRAAFDDPANQDGARMGAIAHWAVYFGDAVFALEALRRGYVDRHGLTLLEIWHPIFAGLRTDSRFKALVVDIGLYDYWRKSGNWGDFARALGDDDFEIIR